MKLLLRAFNLALFFLLPLIASNSSTANGQTRVVDEIRRKYDEVGKKIALSESGSEDSTYAGIVSNELVINKNDHVWPTVGIYRTTFTFYYDSAGTESRHYPDRLRKIVMRSKSSDRSYYEEYFYDEFESLAFYYAKPNEPPIGDEPVKVEQRIFFSGNRPILVITGDRTNWRVTAKDRELSGKILIQGRKLKLFFRQSLNLPE